MLLLFACAPDDPPAETRCDRRDDDGDGEVDEGLETTWYADGDGDGYGTNATALTSCVAPDGYVAQAGDCDDGDPAAHPGAVETCATPADEDCDGTADPDGADGCVEVWEDADGDGLGEGEPACVCDPGGAVTVGGDCDGADVDRGVDCAEGDVVALEGPRILGDGGVYWSLLGAGALTEEGEALALVDNDEGFAVATIPGAADADVPLSDAALLTADVPTWSRPILGDLDGDGLVDLVSAWGESVPDDGGAYTHLGALTAWRGPLTTFAEAWTVDLDALHGAGASEGAFVADLDGDAIPEVWYTLGSAPGAPGQFGAWRVDGGAVTTVAFAEDEIAGRRWLVAPLGDLDGDGVTDLASVSGESTLSVHLGPVDGFPDEADAAHIIDAPPLADVVPLGDVDGDGLDDVGVREARIWVLTTVATGALAEVATARIGPESDVDGESALFVTAGDVGADGVRDLLVSDTVWPRRSGAGNLRGALYVFDAVPVGVVDARAAPRRVYADTYALFGAFPTVLEDGRVAIGAPLEASDVGTGTVRLLDL